MNTHHVAALASGLALSVSAAADPLPPLDPVAQTILNIRLSAAVLATFGEQGGKLPQPQSELVSLDSLGRALGAELRRSLAPRDGWGRALKMAVANPETFVLISFGADGRPDDPGTDPASPDYDIVFARGEFVQRPHAPDPAWKRVAADVRAIATAIESFSVDNDVYPGPTGGLQTIDAIAGELEPTHILALPRVDPWGNPYLVLIDDKSFVLVSQGADGRLDDAYSDVASIIETLGAPGPTSDENGDIVWVDGAFVRWPAEMHDE